MSRKRDETGAQASRLWHFRTSGTLVLRGAIATIAIASCLWMTCAAGGQDAPPAKEAKKAAPDEKTIRGLVAELSAESFDKREAAQTSLSAIGGPALEILKKAAGETKDAEVRERVKRLIEDIQEIALQVARSELYQDFRKITFPSEHFYITGPESAKRVKDEPMGLRVTLPAEKTFKYDGTGVAAKFGIRGDFEITVGIELLTTDAPANGRGVFFELYLNTESAKNEAMSFNRVVKADGRQVYSSARLWNREEGGRTGMDGGEELPAKGKSCLLRIVRIGTKVFLSVRDEAGERFRVLYRLELGPEDVKFLRLGANPGGGPNAIDLRIHDLRVRASAAEAIKPLAKFSAELNAKSTATTAKKAAADPQVIAQLVKQLDDDAFDRRETASKRLAEIGVPALEVLQKAAKNGSSLEMRSRAADLVRAISKALFVEVRRFEGHAEEPERMVTRVAVTADGSRAVSSGSGMLRAWDIASGKQLLAFGAINTPNYWVLTLSRDGKRAIAGGHDNSAHVFDLASGKELHVLAGHGALVTGATLLPDGKRALTASYDRTVRLWDVESHKEVLAFESTGQMVRCLGLSPDGKTLAAADFPTNTEQGGSVRLWDMETGKVIRVMDGRSNAINTVSFSPDGKLVLDGTLRVWETATGKILEQFKNRPDGITYAAFTPDGRRILTGGRDNNSKLRVWDTATGELILESETTGGGIMGIAALPDNRHCLTATRDGLVRLWEWKK